MKKTFLFIITMGLFLACSPSPKEVAQNYTENIAKGDIWEAQKYVSESTEELLNFMAKSTVIEINTDFRFNFIKDSIADDKAWVTYVDQNKTEGIITLIKVDGRWKVNF